METHQILGADANSPKLRRPIAPAGDTWLTRGEASERLGMSKKTLAEYARLPGRGPPYKKFGGRAWYLQTACDCWQREAPVFGMASAIRTPPVDAKLSHVQRDNLVRRRHR